MTSDATAHEARLPPPLDRHDRRLLEQVHPADWRNPEPKGRYDMVVVGAGTGGLVSAAAAAGLGARVALVERHRMGGDCLNVGCVPSKALIRAARAWSEARRASQRFGGPPAEGDGDFPVVMERLRRIRADLSPVDGAPRFRDLGVDVFFGHGRFVSPDRLEVDGASLPFRRAVVATGARAAALPVPGLEEVGYLTNETVFGLTSLPRRLVVIGAGPLGCEIAQAFARLGAEVTVLHRGRQLLPREGPEAAAIVERAMVRDGVRFVHEADVVRAEADGAERTVVYRSGSEEIRVAGDCLLVAAGRAPNVEDLGLEAAGIAYDGRGVRVDDRLRTTNRRVYAVGDVCSPHQFTHAADFQARLVVRNALFFGRARASRLVYPRVTYTDPEVAHVGLSVREAAERGEAVDLLTVPLAEVDRALLDDETDGFLRLLLRKGTDRILGATLVAAHAGEMIGEAALAITAGVGLSRLGATMHPYPTQAEVFRKAADAWQRGRLTPRVRSLLRGYFRLFR